MKLLEESVSLDPSEITLGADHAKHLDEEKISRFVTTLQAGGVLPPVVVDGERGLVAGRNRFEAYGRAGLPVRADVIAFEDHLESMELAIRENIDRKKLTPSQEAEALAQLVWLKEQRDAEREQSALAERQPRRTKTDRVREVAEETGRSQRKVERAVERTEEARNPSPPAEPIVPKPPSIDKVLQKAHELLSEAQSVLEPIKRDIEAIREDFSKKDGRWALLGSVAQAANQARLGAEYVAHARTYLGDMERAKHMKGGNKRPVGAFEVAKGQDSYQESLRPRKADPEAMAQGEQHRHNFEQDEARGRKESLRLAEESKAQRIASGGGLKVPKRKLDVRISDGAGGEVPMAAVEETANAWADAAKVGVGPADDGDNW
jgi:hypothetical protein